MDVPELSSLQGWVGQDVSLDDVDELVHLVQRHALHHGMIPIAGVVSTPTDNGRHVINGFGWNRLREGIPGIHGETGAIIGAGRIAYRHAVITSSLSPCPFCQRTCAGHLGVKAIRILDATNYEPDLSSYEALGLEPTIREHSGCIDVFRRWVNATENQLVWTRDIGEFDGQTPPPVKLTRKLCEQRMAMAAHQARRAPDRAPPVGALVLDGAGEVIGAGHGSVIRDNDPTLIASTAAWRACGSRPHWRDCTLVLTHGADHIAFSMFKIFRFGQLLVGSESLFPGETDAVRRLGVPVTVVDQQDHDERLAQWLEQHGHIAHEYLGADWDA